jgi:hypothetical protein
MNAAREFQQLIKNFTEGLEILQSHNADGHCRVLVEDGDLVWATTEKRIAPEDVDELRRLGWGSYVDMAQPRDGIQWSMRLMIPTTPCPDRLETEAQVAELHAQF